MKFKKVLLLGAVKSKLDSQSWKKICELSQNLKDADCLLVEFLAKIKIDKDFLDQTPKLKYIGTFSTGYGRVDTDYAKKKHIAVCNLPGPTTEAVAEFVFAILLNEMRLLEAGKKRVKKGNYSEAGLLSSEIRYKVFGILGLGRIGKRVAEIALGFGANVRYWSMHRKNDYERKNVKYQDADSLIAQSDFLSLHFVLNSDTQKFLNGKRIKMIKKGAIVINVSPMELVDIDALAQRLDKNDMIFLWDHSDEMSKEDLSKLAKYKNSIIYPPMAYFTKEALAAKQKIFIENLINFLKGTPINRVN